jgi:hypothetical protein
MNEDVGSTYFGFFIDLDLAIKEDRTQPSGLLGRTGTWAFMAIGVLLFNQKHSYMHDMESLVLVLLWIFLHINGPKQSIGPTDYDSWNFDPSEKLGMLKTAVISSEDMFLWTAERDFTLYYKPLNPCLNKMREKILPGDTNWKVENPKLFSELQKILKTAQGELK